MATLAAAAASCYRSAARFRGPWPSRIPPDGVGSSSSSSRLTLRKAEVAKLNSPIQLRDTPRRLHEHHLECHSCLWRRDIDLHRIREVETVSFKNKYRSKIDGGREGKKKEADWSLLYDPFFRNVRSGESREKSDCRPRKRERESIRMPSSLFDIKHVTDSTLIVSLKSSNVSGRISRNRCGSSHEQLSLH